MSIKIYFGVPGSGKTTLAAKLVHDNLKKGIKTFTNVPIKGGLLFDSSDIGRVDISDGQMILDEAGIVFNSRKFKSLPQSTIEWFKLSRHYGITDIHVFSQSYDDMDITLRRLADEIYVVKRSFIPFLFSIRRIKVKVGIDKDTHQIMDQYFFQFLGIKSYLGFHYWHMFDSWSAPDLPIVDWYYSSFDDFTIDKKHSRIIYRKLHKQGKLYWKFFQFLKRALSRKNLMEKSARIKLLWSLSRQKLQRIPTAVGSWRQSANGGPAAAPATSAATSAGTEFPLPLSPDDTEAFKAFFQRPESPAPLTTKEKIKRALSKKKERPEK